MSDAERFLTNSRSSNASFVINAARLSKQRVSWRSTPAGAVRPEDGYGSMWTSEPHGFDLGRFWQEYHTLKAYAYDDLLPVAQRILAKLKSEHGSVTIIDQDDLEAALAKADAT